MANQLKGKAVADAVDERSIALILENELSPVLTIFRVGNKDSDISYENGIKKKSEKVGVKVIIKQFAENVTTEEFYRQLDQANDDNNINGILVFRPLPKTFDDDELRNHISKDKDIDGCCDESLGAIFINKESGFVPCTAQAVIETLDYYNIEVTGKNVVVIGRSLVIGKPVSMLLLNRNATVTICHSKTENIEDICSKADILVCATGRMESINKNYVNKDQTVIDVGIDYNSEKQKLCGDVLYEEVEPVVKNITPVPGGIGSITTSILLNHVVQACYKQKKR